MSGKFSAFLIAISIEMGDKTAVDIIFATVAPEREEFII